MKEEWRDIKGYEGLYQVSNTGKVRSLITNKILKQQLYKCGYLYVGLWKNRKLKYCRVHRLVAEAFLDNPNNLPDVNHKSENKTQNNVDNLEWCDQKYNVNFGTATERRRKTNTNHPSYSKVVLQYDLNGNFIKEWPSTMEIERQLGYTNTNISACCLGKYKQRYGFKWQYKNG